MTILKKLFNHLNKKNHKLINNNFVFDQNSDEILMKIGKIARSKLENILPVERKKVVYFLSYHHSKFMAMVDAVFILSLQLRGAEVYVVRQSYFYDKEDVIFGGVYNNNRFEQQYKLYIAEGRLLNEVLQTKTIDIGAFLAKEDYCFAENFVKDISVKDWKTLLYENFPIGEYAYYATVNMNNAPSIPDDDIVMLDEYMQHIKNCILLILASKRFLSTCHADSYVSAFPLYYQWKIPCILIKKAGKVFYTPFLSERKNSVLWSDNSDKINDLTKAWKTFKDSDEYEKYRTVVEKLINERITGQCNKYNLIPNANSKNVNLINILNAIGDKPTLLFPVNLLVDGSVLRKTFSYENIGEMILDIIEWYRKNPQYNLILKAHPSENIYTQLGVDTTKTFLRTFLTSENIILPENVIYIENDADISVYSLFPYVKGVIAYTSSVCVDAALCGLPSISVDESSYTVANFSRVPHNKNECHQFMIDILQEKFVYNKEQIKTEAKKYYLLFNKFAEIDFKLFEGSEVLSVPKLLFDSADALLPGHNEALDYICDCIIKNKPVFGDNRWPPVTL